MNSTATADPNAKPRRGLPNLRTLLRDPGIQQLLNYVKPYRGQLAAATLLTIFSSGIFLLFPLVSGQLVNSVTHLSAGPNAAPVAAPAAAATTAPLSLPTPTFALPQSPAQIIGVLIVIFLVRAVVDIGSQYLLWRAGESVIFDIRRDVYRRLQSLGLDFFAARRTGELISRLSSDTTVVRVSLVNNIPSLISQVLSLIGAAALIVAINWRLTAIVLVIFPLAALVARFYSRRLRPISTQVQDLSAETSAISEEAISGIRVVKSFGREDYESNKYIDAARNLFNASLRLVRVRATFGPLIGLMFFFALVGILWFGSQEVTAGRLTAGDLVAFLLYGGTVAGGVSAVASTMTQFNEAVGATQRLFEILETRPSVQNKAGARAITGTQGQISFEQVSFAYENGVEVLKNVTLNIAPGEVLALVGPSGAGKSTLFNLIPRFYDPTRGEVCLDGVDLRDLTIESVRNQIAIVPQDTMLFSGSVRENIAYGKLDASDAEIEAAARAANAHDFVTQLPEGYATKVGERGVKLSGGQRQRIAIARAILKDPRILLLDEATSALDSESEGLVQEALGRLMHPQDRLNDPVNGQTGGRTTIIIAHRLSTVHIADRIAVLDQGALIELGTHDELMAQHGLYHRLYSLQFKDEARLNGDENQTADANVPTEAAATPASAASTARRRGFNPMQFLGGS